MDGFIFPPPLVSGEDGTFSVGGLRAGSYSFHASHPYYLHSSIGPLDLAAGEGQRIELKLAPAGRLEGRIKGLAGGQIGKRGVQSTLVLASAGRRRTGPGSADRDRPSTRSGPTPKGATRPRTSSPAGTS
jgi:hypothetical protein